MTKRKNWSSKFFASVSQYDSIRLKTLFHTNTTGSVWQMGPCTFALRTCPSCESFLLDGSEARRQSECVAARWTDRIAREQAPEVDYI
jgi:hypothetical protein